MGGYITPAQEAGMDFADFLADEVKAVLADAPPLLYHYTSAEGMLGIIESGKLRAGSLHRMNDMAEVRFAASVFRASLDRLHANVSDRHAIKLFAAMQKRMNDPISITNVFSISFSRKGDEKSMWNLYAGRGTGFSLCIPISNGRRWSERPPYGSFWRCHYGEDALTAFCDRALSKSEELADRITKERAADLFEKKYNSAGEGADISDFAAEYLDQIAPFAAAFKPKIWSDEEEWRWVFIQPPKNPPPYLELNLNDISGKCSISSLCAGPNCSEENINRVRLALDKVGIRDCTIYRSALSAT